MTDKTSQLIEQYTEMSLAGQLVEDLPDLWREGDHLYNGEFVSPSRPDQYFSSHKQVDAYREALERMDGTIDTSATGYSAPAVQQHAQAATSPQHPPRQQSNPIVDAIREWEPDKAYEGQSTQQPHARPSREQTIVDVIREQGPSHASYKHKKHDRDDDDDDDDDDEDDEDDEDDDD